MEVAVQVHSELWGQAGDHHRGCWRKSHGGENGKESTGYICGWQVTHPATGHSNSKKNLTCVENSNSVCSKQKCCFPKGLGTWKECSWIPGAPGGNEPSIISQLCNVFNVLIFTFIEQVSVKSPTAGLLEPRCSKESPSLNAWHVRNRNAKLEQ